MDPMNPPFRPCTAFVFAALAFSGCAEPIDESDPQWRTGDEIKGGIDCECPDCGYWQLGESAILFSIVEKEGAPLFDVAEDGYLVVPLDDAFVTFPFVVDDIDLLPPNGDTDPGKYFHVLPIRDATVQYTTLHTLSGQDPLSTSTLDASVFEVGELVGELDEPARHALLQRLSERRSATLYTVGKTEVADFDLRYCAPG